MKIEKLACCLAHPVTALRSIKEKVNEIIDAVENLPAGGGSSSGGSGGPGVIAINATTEDMASVTIEKSLAEIEELVNQGQTVRIDLHLPADGVNVFFVPLLTYVSDTNGYKQLCFGVNMPGLTVIINMDVIEGVETATLTAVEG